MIGGNPSISNPEFNCPSLETMVAPSAVPGPSVEIVVLLSTVSILSTEFVVSPSAVPSPPVIAVVSPPAGPGPSVATDSPERAVPPDPSDNAADPATPGVVASPFGSAQPVDNSPAVVSSDDLDGLESVVEDIAFRFWKWQKCFSMSHFSASCTNQIKCHLVFAKATKQNPAQYLHLPWVLGGSLSLMQLLQVSLPGLTRPTPRVPTKALLLDQCQVPSSCHLLHCPLCHLPCLDRLILLGRWPISSLILKSSRHQASTSLMVGRSSCLGLFFLPAVAPNRRHEEFAIAIVEPTPLPEEVLHFRNLVVTLLLTI